MVRPWWSDASLSHGVDSASIRRPGCRPPNTGVRTAGMLLRHGTAWVRKRPGSGPAPNGRVAGKMGHRKRPADKMADILPGGGESPTTTARPAGHEDGKAQRRCEARRPIPPVPAVRPPWPVRPTVQPAAAFGGRDIPPSACPTAPRERRRRPAGRSSATHRHRVRKGRVRGLRNAQRPCRRHARRLATTPPPRPRPGRDRLRCVPFPPPIPSRSRRPSLSFRPARRGLAGGVPTPRDHP